MSRRPDRLTVALRALLWSWRPARTAVRPPATTQKARLDYLERDVREVRTRVNALFFAVLLAVLGDLLARVVAP